MPVPHVATEGRSDEPMRTIRIMVEAYLERHQAFLAELKTLDNLMLLPVPEMQMVAVFARRHIVQIEAAPKGLGGRPLAADHHIVAWLIPVVIVEVHPLRAVFPAAYNVEPLVEEQKPTGAIAFPVTQHRDQNVAIGQTVHGVRSAQVCLCLDLFGFDHLMQFGCPFIRDIQDVNAARERSWGNQKTARFAFIRMTGATGIPTE